MRFKKDIKQTVSTFYIGCRQDVFIYFSWLQLIMMKMIRYTIPIAPYI